MLKSCHIFVGKEYKEIIENTVLTLFKQEPNALSYNHFYSLLEEERNKLSITEVRVSGQDETKIEWVDKCPINQNQLIDYWSERIFDKIFTLSHASQGILYVFIHLPLYKKKSLELTKNLCVAIKKSERPVNVDFVGYLDDWYAIIESQNKDNIDSQKESIQFIKMMYSELNYTAQQNHMIVLQNKIKDGIALLQKEDGMASFYEMIASLSLLFSSHYDNIFNGIGTPRDVVGIGFSSLYFDRYLFAQYLLNMAMLRVMDNQCVNNNQVDVNKSNESAIEILKDKENIFSQFIKEWREKEKEGCDYDLIKGEMKIVGDRLAAYFNQNKDLTARAAVLASILSKTECELFSSSFFTEQNICWEDLYRESIDYFISEDDVHYYSIEKDKATINPITELKRVNRTLLQTEVQKRAIEKQLETYQEQIKRDEDVQKCLVEDGYFQFGENKFRLMPDIDEPPLAETYEPHKVMVDSVDLRSKFSSVKNQGQQGSCLAFTLTSIFEYMMRNSLQEDCDLSEAFLYYNARNLDENDDVNVNIDKGSRFHPSIDSLRKYGIALEKCWPYNENIYNLKPSEEAYKDAETRKLIKALNVECNNVDAIKSALSDGYPVAASFTLFPSFNENGAYIQLPTQEELKSDNGMENEDNEIKRHSRHAMVILGFSEELQMFLVRNSWGDSWGDKGYCYVPYEYVKNPRLFNFACIITEVDSLKSVRYDLKEISALKVNTNDVQIRYYVALASCNNQVEQIKKLKSERESLYKHLEVQKALYSDPNARDEFIEQNINHLIECNENLKKEVRQTEVKQDEVFQIFNKHKIKTWLGIGLTFLCSILLCVLIMRFLPKRDIQYTCVNCGHVVKIQQSIEPAPSSCIVCSKKIEQQQLRNKWIYFSLLPLLLNVYLLIKFLQYRTEWREERDRLQFKIDSNNELIVKNQKRMELFRHKTFVAWQTITSLSETQSKLESLYTKLIHLINNLRQWYIEVDKLTSNLNLQSKFPNILIIDKEKIDAYFDVIAIDKVWEYDLCYDIENHKIDEDYLIQYRNKLKHELTKRLLELLDTISFNISEHVVSNKFSDLAKQVDSELLAQWYQQSNVFVRVKSIERAMINPNNLVFAPNVNEFHLSLSEKMQSFYPTLINNDNKYKMTMVSTVTLDFGECVAFQTSK